jgi:hypothetical protein
MAALGVAGIALFVFVVVFAFGLEFLLVAGAVRLLTVISLPWTFTWTLAFKVWLVVIALRVLSGLAFGR